MGYDFCGGVSHPNRSNIRKCESTVTYLSPSIRPFSIHTHHQLTRSWSTKKTSFLNATTWWIQISLTMLSLERFLWFLQESTSSFHCSSASVYSSPQETQSRNHPTSRPFQSPGTQPALHFVVQIQVINQVENGCVTSNCSKSYSTTPESFISSHEIPSSWSKRFAPGRAEKM